MYNIVQVYTWILTPYIYVYHYIPILFSRILLILLPVDLPFPDRASHGATVGKAEGIGRRTWIDVPGPVKNHRKTIGKP